MKLLPLSLLFLAGCSSIPFLGGSTPAEQSVDPEVIAAVAHAKNMTTLIWMGGLATIGGIAFTFLSSSIFPKSTGLGVGIAAGGLVCIGVAMFEPALAKIAFPLAIVLLVAVILFTGMALYKYYTTKVK